MNLNKYVLKNGLVFLNNDFIKTDILIEDGLIVNMDTSIEYENIIDCTNKLICASFIDPHVHFRTPGLEYKEDLVTGSMAALKGGYSHVFTMPNTRPCLDNYEILKQHLNDIDRLALNHVLPFSAASINLAGKEIVDIDKIASLNIAGFSDDGKGIQSDALMKEMLIKAGKHNKVVAAHCEDESQFINGMGSLNEGVTSKKYDLLGINNESEYKMIERDIKLIDQIKDNHNYQYHVCHLSTKQSLDLVIDAKKRSLNVSCEVTPHHLISDDSQIDINDSNYKMNPPLRSKEDVDYLVAGLNSGMIDVIATDHAPHSIEDKARSFNNAPFGIIGLELAFSLLNTYLVKKNKVELKTILNCLSLNPARIFNIDNQINIGASAYLNIIDLDKEITYTKDMLKSKSSNTFYLNEKLIGVVETTIFKKDIYHWFK